MNPRLAKRALSLGLFLAAAIFIGALVVEHAYRFRQQQTQYYPAPPGMVFVPAGEFFMGNDDPEAEPDERPLRKVFVPAFYIDKFEVTNRQYQKFKPGHVFPEGAEDLPATLVLKSEAAAFCRWARKRLPTNAEWEKAARGTDGRRYPWGNDFLTNRCNAGMGVTGIGLMPGGSFPAGVSPYGAHDMSGNVWEWVSDTWRDRGLFGWGTQGTRRGILRGGAHGYSRFQARASYQGFEGLEATCNDVGFRCAMDAVPRR